MSTAETISAVTLWLIAAGVLALLLLLYRQVDRAYGAKTSNQATSLMPGVELPDVEIMTAEGPGFLELPAGRGPSMLAFLSSDCDRCSSLERTLISEEVFEGQVHCLFIDAQAKGEPEVTRPDNTERVRFFSAAYPPDLPRKFGLNSVPLVYVLDGKTVLAADSAASKAELAALVAKAERQRVELMEEPDGAPAGPGYLMAAPDHDG
jgi:hypothetical protein